MTASPSHLRSMCGNSAERAALYSWLANEAEAIEPTTFTAHDVYEKAARLRDTLSAKLKAADVIMGKPTARATPAHAAARRKRFWGRLLGL